MAAAIIKGGNIISIGNNKYNRLSYPYKQMNGYSKLSGLHAELDAIKKCSKSSLLGATIVITGVTKAGNRILTKPCPACRNAIRAVGIKKIIYFDKSGQKHIERIKNGNFS